MKLAVFRPVRWRLAGLAADLSADPQLRAMLAMFARLHDGEPLPGREQVSRACLALAWARRRPGQVVAVMITGAIAAAIAAGAATAPLCTRPGIGRIPRYAACPAPAHRGTAPLRTTGDQITRTWATQTKTAGPAEVWS